MMSVSDQEPADQRSNKRQQNLLLTCAGGSSTIYLARVLKKKFNIFLVDASDQSIGPLLGFPFRLVPFGTSRDYTTAMQQVIEDWKINCIVPGADEELVPLGRMSHARDIMIVAPGTNFVELCLNKCTLMEALNHYRISSLLPFRNRSEVKYPAIVKPISGRGSRGVHVVMNRTQLDGYLNLYNKRIEDVLVQKYIEGDEYTVSVIVNNLNHIIGIVPKRVISKRGITRIAVSENNDAIEHACRKIVETLTPCGPFNVQLKLFDGQVFIFEINPRLSTTSVLTDQAFGNEVSLFIKYYNRKTTPCRLKMKDGVKLCRYEENIFT